MRIRNVLITTVLLAALVPSAIYGWWSHSQGIKQEFSEVNDRHLLIAENIGIALKRYHTDVVTTFETIASSMLQSGQQPDFKSMMNNMHLFCVILLDPTSGSVIDSLGETNSSAGSKISEEQLKVLLTLASERESRFSGVTRAGDNNVMYLVRKYDDKLAVAYVGTSYFVELGQSVEFGEKGHAAIVDHQGNVLAHPLPEWVESRKNISKVSAVQRMMNGETGVEQFFSPALKGDMIAGLTTVEGPGWGIMVPQPVSEIYAKVYENNASILAAIGLGLIITLMSVFVSVNSLASPLERLARILKSNSKGRDLVTAENKMGVFPILEVREFHQSYNSMVNQVKVANKKITSLAYTDSVTGLPNREKFKQCVIEALDVCSGEESGGTLIFIDLDNFKEINDIHGHDVGDEFLRACAVKLEDISRHLSSDLELPAPTVARIGGDEFTILAPQLIERDAIERFLDLLQMELSCPSDDMGFISDCSASMGAVQYPEGGRSVEELIRHADIAMYQAKKQGKNTAEIYSGDTGERTAAEMRRDVVIAVDENQFELEYQPKVCAATNEVLGVEALVRWHHPELGHMMPDDWLPAINNSPAIANLGTWVVNTAMQDYSKLFAAGHDLKISINIGSRHFVSTGFLECLEAAAKRNDFDRSKLEIEITEDAIFSSETRAEIVLNSLRTLGYSVSIDDFGKGYSNIVRFAQLPVDVIKIDKAIVTNAYVDPRIKTIMESTIAMAHDLDCKIVAEGIETIQQAKFAADLGADMLQGHFFASSKKLDEMIEWIKQSKANQVHQHQDTLQKLTG